LEYDEADRHDGEHRVVALKRRALVYCLISTYYESAGNEGEMRSMRIKVVHLVIVTLIGFPISDADAQNNVGSAPPRPLILKPVGPLRSVTQGVFHFTWNRDQVLKIDSTPARMRAAGTVATFEESCVVLGDTAIRVRSLSSFRAG
jgi:hypothetical protein